VRLALHGAHVVPDALAAAGAALWCQVPFDEVLEAMARAPGSPLRMDVRHVPGAPLLVVDCYNANPASTQAALRALAAAPAARRLALLGVMAELGDAAATEHRRVADLAEELGIEVVGYGTERYGPARVDDLDAAVALVREIGPSGAVLVKGSRVAQLEDVVRALETGPAAQAPATSTRRLSSP
jgi:UDP-N-acetylmuramoyl-tripeptide--D-alanyl-D-alanine ligase